MSDYTERFIFRRVNMTDIAEAIGQPTTEIRRFDLENNRVVIDTPDLIPPERMALRALFENQGFIEDPDLEIEDLPPLDIIDGPPTPRNLPDPVDSDTRALADEATDTATPSLLRRVRDTSLRVVKTMVGR